MTVSRLPLPDEQRNQPSRLGPARRRSPRLLAMGVLLTLTGVVAALVVLKLVSGQQTVLVAARDIPAGHRLEAADLGTATVASTGLSLIASGDEDGLLGQPVAVAVRQGAPLIRADLGTGTAAPAGQTVVAILVRPGQFPPALAAGDTVDLVDADASPTTGVTASAPLLAGPVSAVVLEVDRPADAAAAAASGTVVSVQVRSADAAAVVRAQAANRIAIVVRGAGS